MGMAFAHLSEENQRRTIDDLAQSLSWWSNNQQYNRQQPPQYDNFGLPPPPRMRRLKHTVKLPRHHSISRRRLSKNRGQSTGLNMALERNQGINVMGNLAHAKYVCEKCGDRGHIREIGRKQHPRLLSASWGGLDVHTYRVLLSSTSTTLRDHILLYC